VRTHARLVGPVLGLLALLVGPAAGQQATSWLSPSRESGQFQRPTEAFADGGRAARFRQTESHVYWGYGISLPTGAEVMGIEVRLDASEKKQQGGALNVELSWDGGASWTSTGRTTGPIPKNETTFILGGGPGDTWGRSWTLTELSDANFRVRIVVSGPTVDGRLDWVPVRIYYTLGQSLSVSPATVDFGVLGAAEFERGYAERSPAQTLTISSGTDWVLRLQADAFWSYSGTEPDPLKPAGDLLWRLSSTDARVTAISGMYTGLATSAAQVASGTPGDGIVVAIHFRVLLSYERDPPGSYTLGIIYTLTTP
jgi:hypothetical protein